MIRPFTCVCLLLAAGSGLYLYQTKHQTQMVDREIERTLKLADATWQRSGVLRAEYTLLNDPSRLADLSSQHLPTLQTTAPGQFSTWNDLDRRLPAVGPPPSEAPPGDTTTLTASLLPDAAAPDAAKPEIVKSEPAKPEATRPEPMRAEQPRPEPPRPEPARIEPVRADPPPRPPIAAAPSRPAPVRPDPVIAAAEPAQPRPSAAAPARVSPPPVARSVLLPVQIAPPPVNNLPLTNVAAIRPVPAPPVYAAEAVVTRVARTGPPEPAAPMGGSMLGMARARTPQPQPYVSPIVGSLR